ncbi:MAG: lytic transglycosylase domain-containing protein [Chloroflexi bacterium]|nr:lytic transglycosylase domain-containing protein [Chloroflexota bacterium]
MQGRLLALVLGSLWRDAVKVAAGLALAVLLALAFVIASLAVVFEAAPSPAPVVSAYPAGEIPPEQMPAMQSAAARCSLPWQVLAAVAEVESDFGANMATSSAGAIGYGQFLPDTWAAYGNGGDPYDYRDALPAMARYLCDWGGPEDLQQSLYAYNHAQWYVDLVLQVAARYGYAGPGAVRP